MKKINYSSLEEVVNILWCGIVTDLLHDINNHSVKFHVEVKKRNKSDCYRVFFSGVSALKFSYDEPGENWDYVELTELEIYFSDKKYNFSSELWSTGLIEIESDGFEIFKI